MKRRSRVFRALWLLLPLLLFWGLSLFSGEHSGSFLGLSELDLSERHYLVFPLAVVFGIYVFFQDRRTSLIALVAILPILIFGSRYLFSLNVDEEYSGVVLARLRDDPNESSTLKLREQIDLFANSSERGEMERHFKPLRSHRVALRRFPRAHAVVWGDTHTIRVSLKESGRAITRYSKHIRKQELPLAIIESIPGVEVSFEPVTQTGRYLAQLIEAISLEHENAPEDTLETLYLSMGHHLSRWSSYAHVAYPWFKLGNIYLRKAYESTDGPTSYAQCANHAYSSAAAFLQPYTHPQLRATVFNNKAVLLLLEAEKKTLRQRKETARKLLQKALIIAERGGGGEWRPSKYILRAIRGNLKVLQSGKRRKKRHARKRAHHRRAATTRPSSH
jgi:hypothetical protein